MLMPTNNEQRFVGSTKVLCIGPPKSPCGKLLIFGPCDPLVQVLGSLLPFLALRCPRPSERRLPIGSNRKTCETRPNPGSAKTTNMFPSLPSLAAVLSQPFKRSQLGLFHGKTKQYGNNVPFSKKKTRRSWLPNIQSKRLYSDALGETVRVKVSTRALKTIRKVRRLSVVITS